MLFMILLSISAGETILLDSKEILLENGKTVTIKSVESSEANQYISEGCVLSCAKSCISFSEGYSALQCVQHCNCGSLIVTPSPKPSKVPEKNPNEINELYPPSPEPINKDLPESWFNLEPTSKMTYEKCTASCDTYCKKVKYNADTCSGNCVSKFCGEKPESSAYYWIFLSIALGAVAFLLFKYLSKSYLLSKNLEYLNEVKVGYKKI